MQSLVGTGVALITPFKKDLSVDVEALKKIVHFQIDNQIEYLVDFRNNRRKRNFISRCKKIW